MAGYREEQIVVEGRQLGQLVLQHLWRGFGTLALLLDPRLCSFGEDFVWELPEPVLEQRADNIGVVEVVVCDQVDIAILSTLANGSRGRKGHSYLDQTFARSI